MSCSKLVGLRALKAARNTHLGLGNGDKTHYEPALFKG
jgi:hypothetical protein